MRKDSRKSSSSADLVHAWIFVGLLWLPLAAGAFGWRSRELEEKRALAALPTLGRNSLASLPGRFDRYFNDHFGLRSELIRGHDYLRVQVLGCSSTRQVVVGQDDWLFLVGSRALEDHQGLERFTPDQLETWRRALEGKQAWLAERGIGYLFVVAPNKASIYPERLPVHLQRPGAVTLLDQLVDHLRRQSHVEIVDLRPALRHAAQREEVYFPLDTHWNDRGALAAYQQVCARLKAWFPRIEPMRVEEFRVGVGPGYNDLCPLIGWHGVTRDTEALFPLRGFPTRPAVLVLPAGYAWPRQDRVRQPLALERPGQPGRLLMFHDSFGAQRLRDFLAVHFGRSVFLSLRPDFLSLALVVEQERPDVVIEEWSERSVRDPPAPHPVWTAAIGNGRVLR